MKNLNKVIKILRVKIIYEVFPNSDEYVLHLN